MTNINTNIGALTALKNLEATDAAMSKAMARLSSGLKINNAADDAAGSALATKMEATVRSLNVAIRNSEDAISMTQTAEGALGQMENILQRVRELAVQASNSTLSSNDREMIQNEVTQLITKIDSISASTDFNGIQLLDGSEATVSFQIGTQASDELKVTLNKADATTLGLGGSNGVRTITTNRLVKSGLTYNTGTIAKEDIKINGENFLTDDYSTNLSAVSNAAGQLATALNLNTGVHGAKADAFNTVSSKAKGDFTMSGEFQVNSASVKLASSYADLVQNINAAASGITATLNEDNTITLANDDGDDIILAAGAAGTGLTDVGFTAGTYAGFIGITNLDGSAVRIEAGNVANGYGDTTTVATGTHSDLETFGFVEVKDNVMESGLVSTTALNLSHDIQINDVEIGASTTNSAGSKAVAINAVSGETGVTAVARTELTLLANFTSTRFPPGATDIELNGNVVDLSSTNDLAAIVKAFNDANVGDVRAEAGDDGKITFSSESGVNIKLKDTGSGSATNAMFTTGTDIHGESITASSSTFTAAGNITLTSADGSPIKISGTIADIAHLGLLKQSEELKVSGSGVSVDSLSNAQSSLAKIDSAIEKVSLFRSSFGAIENRIDASMNNLTTLKVNTEASLSRIVDANFAEETSNLTKNQILNQAATSMLAQANASKQNLLALLQG
jgi:flagellin